jgi:hypothetical protein
MRDVPVSGHCPTGVGGRVDARSPRRITVSISNPSVAATPVVVPAVKAALYLVGATLFALALYYVVGVDQGALSVLGHNSYIHEFVHDSRHVMGFPCH